MSGQGGLPQTSAWHQQLPLYYKMDRHQLPTCLLHNLHKPKSPDNVSVPCIYTSSNDIHSIF